MTYFSLI